MQNTPNYNYNLPEYSDSADIAVLNANFSSIDANEYRIEGKLNALGNDIALPYDNTATYSVGDYTIYNNSLYRCITAIATAEDFDDTKWTAITIGGELKSHDARISTLEAGVDLEKSATNSFNDGIDSYFKKVVSTIVTVQAGSGTPSPSNVRAISGFTECTVNDWGVNRFELQFTSQTINGVTFTVENGVIKTQGTANAEINAFIGVSHFDYTGASILSGCPANGSQETYRLIACDIGGGEYYAEWGEGREISAIRYVARVKISIASGTNVDGLEFKPMVIPKTEAGASFEPYKSTTATISFGSAGTVYGGEVDLISGKLVVDRGSVDMGSLNWIKDPNRDDGRFYTSSLMSTIKRQGEGLCSILNHINTGVNDPRDNIISFVASYGVGYIFAIATAYNDATAFTTAVTGQTLVYELATPQEYQLTPAQLRSLVGANRLTSSTGEVTETEYITNETIAWLLDLIRA